MGSHIGKDWEIFGEESAVFCQLSRERLGKIGKDLCTFQLGRIVTRFLKILACEYIFRCGKRIDQFGFAGIIDVTEHDIPACLQCPDPPACIGFAGGEVDGIMQVLFDDVGGISFCAEERNVGWADILCFFLNVNT